MSGFSAEWLALREPADLAARSRKVLEACRNYFSNHTSVRVCDIGAGTGASVRAFSAFLPQAQHWTLVDHDPVTLAHAKTRHGEIDVAVRDFAHDPDCWPAGTGLVTATAFFDLTSRAWIDRFISALAARRLPLLTTLTVDGTLSITPQQVQDGRVFDAFRAHQTGDKGFGAALGGAAAIYLENQLRDAGYTVAADNSPWRVERGELLRQLLDGMARAVRETGLVPDVDVWLRRAQAETTQLIVGHRDVFAAPREHP